MALTGFTCPFQSWHVCKGQVVNRPGPGPAVCAHRLRALSCPLFCEMALAGVQAVPV